MSSSEEDGEPLEVLNRVRKTMAQDRTLGPSVLSPPGHD